MAWSDMAAFTQKATRTVLGESLTYTPDGGSGETLTAIFVEAHEELSLVGDVAVSTTNPFVSIRIADASQTPAPGDTVTRSGVVWTIEDVREDGEGAVLCMLSR